MDTVFTPASFATTPVPTGAALHMMNRFAYGYTPQLMEQMDRAGGPLPWFEQQLQPRGVPDSTADAFRSWWPDLGLSPAEIRERWKDGTEPYGLAAQNLARWTLLRRVHSERQVLEAMVDFWSGHVLHVHGADEAATTYRVSYDRVIRRHALGSYAGMLRAAVVHPAMLAYLDGGLSTKTRPNENLGRELLELHTVGKGAGYTERDVLNSTRILTGWSLDPFSTWTYRYRKSAHWTGPVRVLGFRHANTDPDGRAVVRAYLTYLARHPATARRIARKLAVRFVSDNPPRALVDRLAKVYLAHDTRIRPVLRALVASPEFAESVGRKTRTPAEDMVAALRVLQVRIHQPRSAGSAANALLGLVNVFSDAPYSWPTPDGRPDVSAAWSSVSRMLNSFRYHRYLAAGAWPSIDIAYQPAAAWFPRTPIRFDELVDHLARRLWGRPSDGTVLRAACEAALTDPAAVIDEDHAVYRHLMPLVLGVLLDSPHFFRR